MRDRKKLFKQVSLQAGLALILFTASFARQVDVSTEGELLEATQNARAGDTILVAPGQYMGDLTRSGDPGNLPNGTGYFWIGADGTQEHPIVVAGSEPKTPPTLTGESIDAGYVFHVTGDHVVLKNLEITRGDKGVILDNANAVIVEDCEIHNTGSELIHVRDGSSNAIISRNLIHNAGNGGNGSIGEGLYIGTDQARWGADDRPQSEWGDKAISEGYGGYDWRVTGTKVMYNYFAGSISAELMDVKEGTQNTTVEGNMFVGDSIGKKAGAKYYDDSFVDQKGVSAVYRNNTFFQGGNTLTKYISEVTRNSYAHIPDSLTADDHSSPWCDQSAHDGNEGWEAENEVVTEAVDPRPDSPLEYFKLFGNSTGTAENVDASRQTSPFSLRLHNNRISVQGLHSETGMLTIFSARGRIVTSVDLARGRTTPLPDLSRGVYLLQMQSGTQDITERLIVQ
ncbi:MAG: T9SS type A sorting domain-containing protein [Fibrobacterota bacterium]